MDQGVALAARKQDTVTLAQQLAAQVCVNRVRFRQVYDELVELLCLEDEENSARYQVFLSVILDDHDQAPANDAIAFTRAINAAIEGKWLKRLVTRCVHRQAMAPEARALLTDSAPAKKKRALSKAKRTPAPQRYAIDLQAMMHSLADFSKPRQLMAGLQRVTPKICLVTVTPKMGAASSGTGFLIGPQTILTSWHVIEPLLDPKTRQPMKDSHSALLAEFDYAEDDDGDNARKSVETYQAAEQWLDESSCYHVCESRSGPGMQEKQLRAELGLHDNLDFAVIRLKGSPGRDRGMVALNTEPVRVGNGARVLVFQHPHGFPQRCAHGELKGFCGGDKPLPRLWHLANTGVGSSGGLCVNDRFETIGLHQGSVLSAGSKPVANQAVPTALIAPLLTRAFEVDPTFDPLTELKDTRDPVVGREQFQAAVWRLLRGDKRVVTISGSAKMGLGFSVKIARSLLSPADALLVEITADQIGSDAHRFATLLLERCGQLPSAEQLPALSTAATTTAAAIRDQLVIELVRRLRPLLMGKQLWLTVRHLDRHKLQEGSPAAQLLYGLIAATIDADFMRFVLLGADVAMASSIPPQLVDPDMVMFPARADVRRYIQRRCALRNVTMLDADLDTWTDMGMMAASSAGSDAWAGLVQYLKLQVHPFIEHRSKRK